jgi:rsbT co-antagonist protein RsbR
MSALRGSTVSGLFEHLPAAIHIYRFEDPQIEGEPLFVAANPAAERALGSAAAGLPLATAFPALRAAGLAELCARVARSGEPASLGEVRPGSGEVGTPALRVRAFPLEEGRVGVMFEDLRALGAAHAEALRLLRLACQAVIDLVPDVVFVKTAGEQRYVLCNQAAATVVGETTASVIGRRTGEQFPPEVAAALEETERRIMAGNDRVLSDELIPMPGKGLRTFHITKMPVRGSDGTPLFLAGFARDVSEHRQVEEALAKSRAELHATKSSLLETIRQLSTPVLPIHDGILVVPLVGHMDSQRGGELTEALLSGIQRHRAGTVIIDITGVEMVDTAVASHLIQATRAAALLGTECVLVGIAPAIARTLVQIGTDFGGLTTRRDLQAGVAYALAQRKGRVTLPGA